MEELQIIGRAERIELLDLGVSNVPAKIDTGADSSSIWVSKTVEAKDGLHCVFFGPGSKYYTGKELTFAPSSYGITRVANSFGHKEIRYKLKLRVCVNGKLVKATFTLSDRSQKTYPILIGRRLLAGKFLVDVRKGNPLKAQEQQKKRKLKQDMKVHQLESKES